MECWGELTVCGPEDKGEGARGTTLWFELLLSRVIGSLRLHFAAGPIDYRVRRVHFPFDACCFSRTALRLRCELKKDGTIHWNYAAYAESSLICVRLLIESLLYPLTMSKSVAGCVKLGAVWIIIFVDPNSFKNLLLFTAKMLCLSIFQFLEYPEIFEVLHIFYLKWS